MKKAYYADGTSTDSTWFENDGIVNKISMYGPTTGANGPDLISKYSTSELLIPGQWYTINDSIKMDHRRMIGHGTSKKDYNKLIEMSIKPVFSSIMSSILDSFISEAFKLKSNE